MKDENLELKKKLESSEVVKENALSNSQKLCSRIDRLQKDKTDSKKKLQSCEAEKEVLQSLVRGLASHQELIASFQKIDPIFDKSLLAYLESIPMEPRKSKQQNEKVSSNCQ